ncbi:MAG: hypothetical protein WC916_07380 [Candidatus Woesearchaeota archaeon]
MPLSEEYLRSVSESQLKDRAYTPFELAKYERDSIEDIKKSIKNGTYKDREIVKESMEFIEALANRMNVAITNEKKENKTTWELETELNDIKKVFDLLENLLKAFDEKEARSPIQKKNRAGFTITHTK